MNIEQDEPTSQPTLPDANKKALAREAFGLWANRADLDDEWLKVGRERWYSVWQENEEAQTPLPTSSNHRAAGPRR